jgi:hypothetical protein
MLTSAGARKLKAPPFVIDGEAVWLDLMANLDLNQELIWMEYLRFSLVELEEKSHGRRSESVRSSSSHDA